MNVIPTAIPDVKLIAPRVFGDARGWFYALHQLTREEDRPVQHAEHNRNAVEVFEIVIDALRHRIDGLFQPLVRNVRNEILVFKQDSVHCENRLFQYAKIRIFSHNAFGNLLRFTG